MSLLLFGNQQQIGSGEARDHNLGPVSVLVTSLQSHQPFLKSKTRREILRDRRRNKRLFDIFQMKGQGRALRAMRQGRRPLASACKANLCGPPGGSSQELGGGGDVTFGGTESRLMGVRAGRAFCTEGGVFSCLMAACAAPVQGATTDFICTHARQVWETSVHHHGECLSWATWAPQHRGSKPQLEAGNLATPIDSGLPAIRLPPGSCQFREGALDRSGG